MDRQMKIELAYPGAHLSLFLSLALALSFRFSVHLFTHSLARSRFTVAFSLREVSALSSTLSTLIHPSLNLRQAQRHTNISLPLITS